MKISAADGTGRSPAQLVENALRSALGPLESCGNAIQKAIVDEVKSHFQTIYPGSRHYSPDKVTGGKAVGAEAEVHVDVPGITRAYRSLDILPVRASRLAIPVDGAPDRPGEVDGLFYARSRKGTEMLAKTEGGALVVMYILKDRIRQDRRPGLMPSDEVLAEKALEAAAERL